MARVNSTTKELLAEIEFWIGMYGKALDALDECAGDDEEGWDRQRHAEEASARLHAEHKRNARGDFSELATGNSQLIAAIVTADLQIGDGHIENARRTLHAAMDKFDKSAQHLSTSGALNIEH